MKSKILFVAYFLCVFCTEIDSLGIKTKLEFGEDSASSKSSEVELIEEFNDKKQPKDESKESVDDKEDSVKFLKSGSKPERLTDKDVVCNSNKCVVEIENGSNKRKTSTDIHVKISTKTEDNENVDKKKPKVDDYEVPVIKGYAGVKPEDVNKKDNEDNGVGINIPMDHPNIIYSGDPDSAMPSITLRPPKYHPNNWHDYLDSKTTQKPDYHPYTVGEHQNHIPQGWINSGWKPVVPTFANPGDYYHYNVNNKERGFADSVPHYFNYCTCTRKPVFHQRPSFDHHHHHHHSDGYPRGKYPWYDYETTTKTVIDDKLEKPFSETPKTRRFS